MTNKTYMTPELNVLGLIQEGVLCASLDNNGTTAGGRLDSDWYTDEL